MYISQYYRRKSNVANAFPFKFGRG